MLIVASADSRAAIVAAIVAAVVAAVVGLVGMWITGVASERARRRRFYADALAGVIGYREFAYVVRRRRQDDPAGERVRISEAMRQTQNDLARFEALMKVERAANVAAAYRELVARTREIAGGYVRSAWGDPPVTEDKNMNIAGVDYAALDKFETTYLAAVATDLAWWRVWR